MCALRVIFLIFSPFCYVCPQRVFMFELVNAWYVFMLVVVTKYVAKGTDVVLAAIAALEASILVLCISAMNANICNSAYKSYRSFDAILLFVLYN